MIERLEFREAVIIFLAKAYGKFMDRANEIIQRYNLTDEDIEKIINLL